MRSVVVRPARPNDLDSLLVLLREFADAPAPGRTAAEPAEGALAREILVSVLEQPGRTLLVGEIGGGIVGTADPPIPPNLIRPRHPLRSFRTCPPPPPPLPLSALLPSPT